MTDNIDLTPPPIAASPVRRGLMRWQIWLLAAVFIVPVVASCLSYYVFRPEGTSTSFGTLIDPQRPLPDVAATGLDGKAIQLTDLKGQWLLVSVAGGDCDARCESNLYLQRQMWASLGKNQDRLDWVWLVDDQANIRPQILPALAEATVLRVAPQTVQQWLQPEPGHDVSEHLYVVDPMGHWMMRFPADLTPESAKKARRDLGRLLYVASGWDKPGRQAP